MLNNHSVRKLSLIKIKICIHFGWYNIVLDILTHNFLQSILFSRLRPTCFILDNVLFHVQLLLLQNIVDGLIIWFYSLSHMKSTLRIQSVFITLRMSLDQYALVLFERCLSWFMIPVFRNTCVNLHNRLRTIFGNLIFRCILISSLTAPLLKYFWHFVLLNNISIFNIMIHFVQILRYLLITSIWTRASTVV